MKNKLSICFYTLMFFCAAATAFGQKKEKDATARGDEVTFSIPKRGESKIKGGSAKAAGTENKMVKKRRKENKKNAKLMQKPQYSNPMYFGHKRPPKKRPPGKQKVCKECGMKH